MPQIFPSLTDIGCSRGIWHAQKPRADLALAPTQHQGEVLMQLPGAALLLFVQVHYVVGYFCPMELTQSHGHNHSWETTSAHGQFVKQA